MRARKGKGAGSTDVQGKPSNDPLLSASLNRHLLRVPDILTRPLRHPRKTARYPTLKSPSIKPRTLTTFLSPLTRPLRLLLLVLLLLVEFSQLLALLHPTSALPRLHSLSLILFRRTAALAVTRPDLATPNRPSLETRRPPPRDGRATWMGWASSINGKGRIRRCTGRGAKGEQHQGEGRGLAWRSMLSIQHRKSSGRRGKKG
jgi:hypothetical protein